MTRKLVIAATLVNSILSSGNINRAMVDMPAWRQVGVVGWAAFSRHADLGPTAMILYPLDAFAGALLSIAAVLSFHRDARGWRSDAIPLYVAALSTVAGLLITTQAAPFMLSVRHLGNDTAALQRAFDGFEAWGAARGVFQVGAFVASVWALATLTPRTTR